MEIGALGSDEFVLGFRLAGIKAIYIANKDNYYDKMVEVLSNPNVGVLAVDANDLQYLPANYKKKILESIQPVIVAIGGSNEDLREKVKRVIGVDLYKEEE